MQKEMCMYQEMEVMSNIEQNELTEGIHLIEVEEANYSEMDQLGGHGGRAIYDFYK